GGGAPVAVRRDQHNEPSGQRAQDGRVAQGGARARGDQGADLRAQARQGEPVRAPRRRRQRAAAHPAEPHGRGAREPGILEGRPLRRDGAGRMDYYGLGTTEKSPFWLEVTGHGTAGHGSRPTPDNPVHRLVRALYRIAAYQTPLVVTPAVERYLRDLSAIEPDPVRRTWLADVRAALKDSAAVRALTGDLTYNALLRNTISITGLTGSDKTNVIPPVARAGLDVRLLPG